MSWTIWAAVVVVCVTVWALIKRYETRLVLLVSGLVMALLSLDPMMAFKQFDKSMTNGSLIIAICSAMGFAAVISVTKCDAHLVRLLTQPLKRMGIFLLPACMAVTSVLQWQVFARPWVPRSSRSWCARVFGRLQPLPPWARA